MSALAPSAPPAPKSRRSLRAALRRADAAAKPRGGSGTRGRPRKSEAAAAACRRALRYADRALSECDAGKLESDDLHRLLDVAGLALVEAAVRGILLWLTDDEGTRSLSEQVGREHAQLQRRLDLAKATVGPPPVRWPVAEFPAPPPRAPAEIGPIRVLGREDVYDRLQRIPRYGGKWGDTGTMARALRRQLDRTRRRPDPLLLTLARLANRDMDFWPTSPTEVLFTEAMKRAPLDAERSALVARLSDLSLSLREVDEIRAELGCLRT